MGCSAKKERAERRFVFPGKYYVLVYFFLVPLLSWRSHRNEIAVKCSLGGRQLQMFSSALGIFAGCVSHASGADSYRSPQWGGRDIRMTCLPFFYICLRSQKVHARLQWSLRYARQVFFESFCVRYGAFVHFAHVERWVQHYCMSRTSETAPVDNDWHNDWQCDAANVMR